MTLDVAAQIVDEYEGLTAPLNRTELALADGFINPGAALIGRSAGFGNTVSKRRVVHSVFAMMPVNSGKQARAIADRGDDNPKILHSCGIFSVPVLPTLPP